MSILKSTRPSLVKEFIPSPELYSEYFDFLTSKGKVYVCVITGPDRKFSVYTELSEEKETSCHVFHIKDDAEYYKEYICAKEKISYGAVNIWECQIPDFISFLLKLAAKNKEKTPPKTVRALASVIRKDRLHSIDTFWASDSGNMV